MAACAKSETPRDWRRAVIIPLFKKRKLVNLPELQRDKPAECPKQSVRQSAGPENKAENWRVGDGRARRIREREKMHGPDIHSATGV